MKFLSYLAIIILYISCNSEQSINEEIIFDLKNTSKEIELNNFFKLQKVTTEKGYKSLLGWSDSLKNKVFIEDLVLNLSQCKGSSIKVYDNNVIGVSLGDKDVVLGATGGFIFLIKDNDKYKIDLFRGGK